MRFCLPFGRKNFESFENVKFFYVLGPQKVLQVDIILVRNSQASLEDLE